MRVTRLIKSASGILFLVVVLSVCSGCEKIEREKYSNDLGRFVRFNLQVNNDGNILGPGVIDPRADLVSVYHHASVATLAIPVTVTSEPLTDPLEVYFSVETSGSYSDFSVQPYQVLRFSGREFTDTLYIDFHDRWEGDGLNSILLQLDSTSNDSILIGNLNDIEKNDRFTVILDELFLQYHFPIQNSIEILGVAGEEVPIRVEFPDGLFPGELESVELVTETGAEFEYTLERQPVGEDDLEVVYVLTVAEAIDIDENSYYAGFELADIDNYLLTGKNTFTVTKPEIIPRDNEINMASYFYDLDDGLYRTYGENWMDYNEDDTCEWRSFNAFTYPVEVASTHPNAVLYDDQGTPDPSDDIYHHAFRIGFNSPNVGNTTNSFNLKRWFKNESINAENSPGFNITQALEFYPDEGTSSVSGEVKVIPQDLIISANLGDGNYRSHTIAIEGEGEYIQISEGVFELTFELRATNIELFGGTRVAKYKLFNTDEYPDPLDITEGCFKPMDL